MLKNWSQKLLYSCLESMPLWSVIFLLNPVIISIHSDKHLDYQETFLILLGAFFLFSVTTALFLLFLSNKYYKIAISFIRSLFVIAILISIFYPNAGRPLDGGGSELPSLKYFIVLYSTYIIGLMTLITLFLRNIRLVKNLYIILSITVLGVFSYYYLNNLFSFDQSTKGTNQPYSYQTNLSFGSERNIIFIIADMLQGSILEQFFTMNPEEKKFFDGFTFYSRAISPFPFTSYSLPAILTGNLYGNNLLESSCKFAKEACLTSSFVTDAASFGFDFTSIGIQELPLSNNHFYFKGSTKENTALSLFDLSMKRIIKFSVIEFLPKKLQPKFYLAVMAWKINSSKIMRRLASEKIGNKKNRLLLFHSIVPHVPVMFSPKDLNNPIYCLIQQKPKTIKNLFKETKFFIGELKNFVKHLKSIGVYDKSLIVITGDHGHFYTENKNLSDYPGAEDFECWVKTFKKAAGSYNPAILIKPPFSKKNNLQITRVPSTTLKLRSLVKRYLYDNNTTKLNLLKDFENIDKQKIVVYKNKTKTKPHGEAKDHIILEFTGNVSKLPDMFRKKIKKHIHSYKIGEKLEPFITNNIMAGSWISEKKGSWLIKPAGIVYINKSSINKNKKYKLRIVASAPIVYKTNPIQRVNLVLNGINFGMISITKPGVQTLEMNIPTKLISNSKVNTLEFQPLDVISPTKVGVWKSATQVSIYVYSFQIVESN